MRNRLQKLAAREKHSSSNELSPPSAIVPGGVDDSDGLHQLLNFLSRLSFDFSDLAEKFNHATNLHLFADSGGGTCPTSPTPDGDLPPIIDFDPLGLHQPPTPTPDPNIQGAFDTLPLPIILPVDPPRSNNKVPTDLGGAYTFTGKTASGNNDAVQGNQYTFGIANSELNSTESDTVLVGVSVASKDHQGLPELPEVGGLTPILTSSNTNSTYSLFSINRSGLNLLSLRGTSSSTTGAYTLKLNVAGDINSDGRVDISDRQLLENALGRTATDPDYTIDQDINRDGIINSADQTILNSNFGFIANLPPVVSPFSANTHTELETIIPLIGKATDPEGDPIFYNALNPVNGTVQFDPITKTAFFKPTPGFNGIASFELAARDGYNWGVPAKITVNVSGAPLLSLDFANRNLRLYAGDSTELTVLGDFADQKGVVLPDSYLTYTSLNPGVAPIDAFGKVTGLAEGTSIFSASHKNIQAVTAARVGELPQPTTDTELNQVLGEMYGLNPYPHAVTLIPGATRKLSIGLNSEFSQANLTTDADTHYFTSNSNILNVSSDGIITAKAAGNATVTAIYGAGSVTIPVKIEVPVIGNATVGTSGGVVSSTDGTSTVMVAPGALNQDTAVSIAPLNRENLSLPLPAGFEFAGAFNLDFSGGPLNLPTQLAIPAPSGLAAGTQVYFMRKGAIPDETGTWNPIWLQEESGIVGTDGTIRTSSPPYPGVIRPGEYAVLYSSPTGSATLVKGQLTLNYNVPLAFLGIIDPLGGIGQLLEPDNFVPAFTVTQDISSVKVVAIPKIGLPIVTEVGVQRNPNGIATFKAALDLPAPTSSNPTTPPVLQKAELKFKDSFGLDFENKEPLLFLTGGNILVNNARDSLGSRFEDLTVKFHVGNQVFEGQVVPTHSRSLGGNQYEIAVKIPETVPLGASRIVVTRKQNQIVDQNGTAPISKEIKYDSNPIQLPEGAEYVFAALGNADRVAVLNAKNPELVVENTSSKDLLSAQIPVGTSGVTDWAEASATTSDGTRVYVALRESGQVALIDPIVLKQVDTQPNTLGVNPIVLPTGAKPKSIVIDSRDEYAYIADRDQGKIYVLDIDPFSVNYNKVIQTISIGSTTTQLRNVSISSDGHKLFASASDNYIYAINIDPKDQPNDPSSNQNKWHQQIGKVLTPNGVTGLTATADPLKMVFTSGNTSTDGKGYGVLEITNDDPLNFTATNRYIDLSLGSANDYFDVNEGVSVTVMRDGRYAFVAGRNFRDNVNPDADVRSGSNIGIIKDPLGPNPQLIAATRPIPGALTNDLVLSADNKSLFSSYPAPGSAGGVYAFNVEEMIKTLEHPELYKIDSLDRGIGSTFFNPNTQRIVTVNDFARVPIDDINPAISIAADYGITKENRPANQFTYGVLPGTKRAPVGTGGNLRDLSIAPTDWLDLLGPGATTNDLTPTLNWKFAPGWEDVKEVNLFVSTFDKGEGLLPWDKVVDLSDSTLLGGLSQTQKRQLLSQPWNGYDDFNPNRILTATWKKDTGKWYGYDGVTPIDQPLNDPANTSTSFTLPKSLTAGQKYNFAVEAVSNNGVVTEDFGQFQTIPPVSNSPFSSVSVLTPGFTLLPGNAGIDDSFYQMAGKIASVNNGLIMRYDKPTGYWVPIDSSAGVINDLTGGLKTSDTNYLSTLANNLKNGIVKDGKKIEYLNQNKPLVLLNEWSLDRESVIPDVGFSEGAGDALFASLVQLDQALGGGVGEYENNQIKRLYDNSGNLIRTQGAVFNSPLHFIGFSRGTVVNSEIIQRLGTYFPNAGGTVNSDGTPVLNSDGKLLRDLQMTTVDPHDFYQPSLKLTLPKFVTTNFSDFYEPKVQVWNNVTFADNYYQTVANPNGFTATPNGRSLAGLPQEELDKNPRPAGLNFPQANGVNLGQPDLEVLLGTREGEPGRENSRIGFTKDDDIGGTHKRTWAWYGGTVDLDLEQVKLQYPHVGASENPQEINDMLGERGLAELSDPNYRDAKAWYDNGEGVGEGWFYSVLGGGKQERKLSSVGRVPVSFDNTLEASMRGDYAVPTLFNGNFDQFIPHKSKGEDFGRNLISKEIPGWSFHNGATSTFVDPTQHLVDWKDIPTLVNSQNGQPSYLEQLGINPSASDYQPNYALELKGGESISHNRFVIPNEDILRLSVHVPEAQLAQAGTLTISMQADVPGYETYKPMETIYLEKADNQDRFQVQDTRKINYGTEGFETFPVKIPESLRGKVGTLKFEVNSSTIYLDNIFFGDSTRPWKPSMTRAEAEDYTGTSYYRGKVFYHGTNTVGSQSISFTGINPALFDEYSTYGPGFYLGSSETIAKDYARQLSSASVLDIMLKAKNPATFPYGVNFTQKAASYASDNSIYDAEPSVVYTDFLKTQGIDTVEIIGLQYFVVYDPKQVVVIGSSKIK